MGSVKNIKFITGMFVLGLCSECVSSDKNKNPWPKYFPPGKGPDWSLLGRQEDLLEAKKQQQVAKLQQALSLLGSNSKRSTVGVIPWEDIILLEDDEIGTKKSKELIEFIPVPVNIVFSSGTAMTVKLGQKLKSAQLRQNFCKILAFMKQEHCTHFAILFTGQRMHTAKAFPFFSQEKALLEQNIDEITATFNDRSQLWLKYNLEWKFWNCWKT